ncbi:MAG: hypothetical protein DDT35_00038 [Firmicutes bacterium]|nr:hypothetical protein [Bacillota bacterium]
MKRIAPELRRDNRQAEFYHCSADYNSLDGICFPDIGVTILDGTAPHVVDPKHPGAIDEIVNLGEYWHAPALRSNRDAIISLTQEIARLFRKAYGFLRSARNYYDEHLSYYADAGAVNIRRWREIIGLLEEAYLPRGAIMPGYRERHLFATAITPVGPMSLLSSVTLECQNIVVLEGEPGTGAEYIIEHLFRIAQCHGYAIHAFHCVMRPELIEHLVIPQLSLGIVTSRTVHPFQSGGTRIENLNSLVDGSALSAMRIDMDCVLEESKRALQLAISFLARAKALHDELETYYIPHMDFARVDAKREQVLKELREMAPLTSY